MDSQVRVLHRRTQVGRSEHYVATFLERASGRIHYTVLSKFSNSFFVAIPPINALSYSSDSTFLQKQNFARTVDVSGAIYLENVYMRMWLIACRTARQEVLAACHTARQNFLHIFPTKLVSTVPIALYNYVSMYFLAFLVIKVHSFQLFPSSSCFLFF